MKIWLTDLTYTQQSISSDVVPAAIGMIAEYIEEQIPSLEKIKLYKYPEKLAEDLSNSHPDLIGFSNYVWNSALSDAFMEKIKRTYPETIIVVGGPSFSTNEREQEDYLKSRPWIDYYIIKEGERAFAVLVEKLMNKADNADLESSPNLVELNNN